MPKTIIFQSIQCNNINYSHIEGMKIHVLSKEDMITNKKASGRYKDLADIEMLGGRGIGQRK
ncbi:MAG: hypothetical protein LBM77_14355 [Spirochaetaceae bacterium]|nr:hypothetical protein [Spirochaetaceae bacterium]